MKKIIRFFLRIVDYFSPEVYDDDIAVKKADGIVRHLEVPDDVLGIYSWHGLLYLTATKSPVPSDSIEKLKKLSALRCWKNATKAYLTTHEWLCILHSNDPEILFVQMITDIEKRFVIPKC